MPSIPNWLAWSLAAFSLFAGYAMHGWPGVLLAVTIVVFWLLLQFNRAMRTMRMAAGAPIGHVASAVMLNAKLQKGMTLSAVMMLTRSLGQREPGPTTRGATEGTTETYCWRDAGDASVLATFDQGRLVTWVLARRAQHEGDNSPT